MSCISAQQFMTCLSAFPLLGCSLQLQANYTKKKAAILARGKLLFFFFSKMKGWYFLTILSKPVAFYLAIMPQH